MQLKDAPGNVYDATITDDIGLDGTPRTGRRPHDSPIPYNKPVFEFGRPMETRRSSPCSSWRIAMRRVADITDRASPGVRSDEGLPVVLGEGSYRLFVSATDVAGNNDRQVGRLHHRLPVHPFTVLPGETIGHEGYVFGFYAADADAPAD